MQIQHNIQYGNYEQAENMIKNGDYHIDKLPIQRFYDVIKKTKKNIIMTKIDRFG